MYNSLLNCRDCRIFNNGFVAVVAITTLCQACWQYPCFCYCLSPIVDSLKVAPGGAISPLPVLINWQVSCIHVLTDVRFSSMMLDIAIIGAGLSGLSLAQQLRHHDRSVAVFESRARFVTLFENLDDEDQENEEPAFLFQAFNHSCHPGRIS